MTVQKSLRQAPPPLAHGRQRGPPPREAARGRSPAPRRFHGEAFGRGGRLRALGTGLVEQVGQARSVALLTQLRHLVQQH